MSSVECPRLTVVQEAGEDNGFVHFNLGKSSDISVVLHTRTQASKGLASLVDSGCDFFVEGPVG